jgi:PHD/YefM family antitoxin component YafN of YafNO toxin-antitoxin module
MTVEPRRAEREHERVAALKETLQILSDPDAVAAIRESRAEIARGEVVRGVDAIRALRSRS